MLRNKLEDIIKQTDLPGQLQVRADVDLLLSLDVNSEDDLIQSLSSSSTSIEAATVIVWGLGVLQSKRAAVALLSILVDIRNDRKLRVTTAASLGQIRSKRLIPKLIQLLNSSEDQFLRQQIIYILGWTGDKRAIIDLIKVLNDTNELPSIRGQAAEGLANLGASSAAPALLNATADLSPEVRFWSVYALGHVGGLESVPYVSKLKNDNSTIPGYGTIAEEATLALRQIEERIGD